MLVIATKRVRVFAPVLVFNFVGGTSEDQWKAFETVEAALGREVFDITVQHFTIEECGTWIGYNVRPSWFERLIGRIRWREFYLEKPHG